MHNKRLFTLISIALVFVFITSLFSTIHVLADDATPPPAATDAPIATSVPVATDVPTTTDAPIATDVPAATNAPIATDAPTQDITVPEALAQLPDGTGLVILDQNGTAVPLASTNAAGVLAAPDPYFFDGTNWIGYTSGGPGSCPNPPVLPINCNDSTSTPIQDAVDAFAASGTATGSIYVEAGSYAEDVVVDGTAGSGYLSKLTGIVGDGSSTTFNDGSFSIFNMNAFTLSGFNVYDGASGNGYVYAHDNSGTLTLNDLIVSNPSGTNPVPYQDGIDVVNQNGDVELTSVDSSNNNYSGAYIQTLAGGNVTVTRSTFNNNGDYGLIINTQDNSGAVKSGNVSLSNVDANSNNWNDNGIANADITTYGGDIKITSSYFNDNDHCNFSGCWGGDGLDAYANSGGPLGTSGSVTLDAATTDDNYYDGAYIRTHGGTTVITNKSDFSENGYDGLDIGAYRDSNDFAGSVTLDSISAYDNGWNEGGAGAVIRTSGGGAVWVSNSFFDDNGNEGLKVRTYDSSGSIKSGNITLTTIEANSNNWNDNGYANADIKTYGGDVAISSSIFNNNFHGDCDPDCWGGDGLDVSAYAGGPLGDNGNITLDGVTADYNYYAGAFLESGCGCVTTTGSIFVDSSSFDHNGDYNIPNSDSRGLVAYSNSDITLANVSASANGGGGAELENCFPTSFFGSCTNTNLGQITISNSAFNDNGYNPPDLSWLFGGGGPGPYGSVGLWAESTDNLTLNGVTADGNGWGDLGGGAFLLSEDGALSISNSNFSENCTEYCDFFGFGIMGMDLGGDITLNGVTASANGDATNGSEGFGALTINLGGNTLVENSSFNNNCILGNCFGSGIGVLSFGNVYFDHVNAIGNGDDGVGASIETAGNVDIYCSTFSNNGGYGLQINTSGAINLNGVTFSGNALGDIDPSGSGTLTVSPFNCNPGVVKKNLPGLPLNIVNADGGQSVELDCTNFSGTQLILPNNDYAIFPCPLQDSGKLDIVTNDSLPGNLPNGNTFGSGFTTHLIKDGKDQSTCDPAILLSFNISDSMKNAKLTILFWDGNKWVEVEGHTTADGHFEAATNFTGTFVLVSK